MSETFPTEHDWLLYVDPIRCRHCGLTLTPEHQRVRCENRGAELAERLTRFRQWLIEEIARFQREIDARGGHTNVKKTGELGLLQTQIRKPGEYAREGLPALPPFLQRLGRPFGLLAGLMLAVPFAPRTVPAGTAGRVKCGRVPVGLPPVLPVGVSLLKAHRCLLEAPCAAGRGGHDPG